MRTYSAKTKVIAVVLLVIAILMAATAVSEVAGTGDTAAYESYYKWEIVGASVEKQEDGRYLITADIKNTSAYRAYIDRNAVTPRCVNGGFLENELPECPDGGFYRSLYYCTVPAGQTAKYQMLITPPEDADEVTLTYFGTSYYLDEVLGRESEQGSFTVPLL